MYNVRETTCIQLRHGTHRAPFVPYSGMSQTPEMWGGGSVARTHYPQRVKERGFLQALKLNMGLRHSPSVIKMRQYNID